MNTQETAQKLRILRIEKENNLLHLELLRYKRALEESEQIAVGLYCALHPETEGFDIRDLAEYGRGVSPGDVLAGDFDQEMILSEIETTFRVASEMPEDQPYSEQEFWSDLENRQLP